MGEQCVFVRNEIKPNLSILLPGIRIDYPCDLWKYQNQMYSLPQVLQVVVLDGDWQRTHPHSLLYTLYKFIFIHSTHTIEKKDAHPISSVQHWKKTSNSAHNFGQQPMLQRP